MLITLRFAGTRYAGFQVQINALSVCTAFQDALEQITGDRGQIKGCSRTDAGVHANKYCLSLKTTSKIAPGKLLLALNRFLPEDIAAVDIAEVPPDFHARYSAAGKEYLYKLRNSRIKDPFSPQLSYRFGFPLDEKLLDGQAQAFVGKHDFAAFQAKGGDIQDTVRTIVSFRVVREGEYIHFIVRGDGFLYKMVRIMVGTLIDIGRGKLPPGCLPAIIESKNRSKAGKTAPACGLYLNDVFY